MQGAEGTTPCDPLGWDSAAASQRNSLTKLRALALAVPKAPAPIEKARCMPVRVTPRAEDARRGGSPARRRLGL